MSVDESVLICTHISKFQLKRFIGALGVSRVGFAGAYILLAILVTSITVQAQETALSTSSESSEADDTTETSASKGAEESQTGGASLSEGFSVREAVSLNKKSNWSSVANAGYNRYLVELAEPTWSLGGSLSYRLTERDSLSASAGYSAPLEMETATPEYYGVSDVELSWTRRNVWTHEQVGAVSSSVKWRLPTSELSQRLTQISGFTGGLTLRRPMPVQSSLRNLTLSASVGMAITPHQYDRRAMGDLNSPFGFSYGGGGTYNLLQKVNLSTSYSMYHRVEYDGYMKRIQTLSAGAVVTLPESIFLSGGYQWRDSVWTNDPFLDADKTLTYLELSRAF